ncbi:MAG: hypothetical protein J6J35_04855 [Alphaproteobacteria bacterium]|nr:hypothetical protein [Alphaproteobacteria bacterium]
MTIYKRSKLTPEILKQWKRDAQKDLIYIQANSIFDLQMAISESEETNEVELTENGKVLVDGYLCGYWRQKDNKYIWYTPGEGLEDTHYASSTKIIQGPWK